MAPRTCTHKESRDVPNLITGKTMHVSGYPTVYTRKIGDTMEWYCSNCGKTIRKVSIKP